MDQLVTNLMEAYRQRIETRDWMSPETKKKALLKLATPLPAAFAPAPLAAAETILTSEPCFSLVEGRQSGRLALWPGPDSMSPNRATDEAPIIS